MQAMYLQVREMVSMNSKMEILSSFIIQITVLLLLSIMKAKAIKSLVVLSLIKKATYGW